MKSPEIVRAECDLANASRGGNIHFPGMSVPCQCNSCEKDRASFMDLLMIITSLPEAESKIFWEKMKFMQGLPDQDQSWFSAIFRRKTLKDKYPEALFMRIAAEEMNLIPLTR